MTSSHETDLTATKGLRGRININKCIVTTSDHKRSKKWVTEDVNINGKTPSRALVTDVSRSEDSVSPIVAD